MFQLPRQSVINRQADGILSTTLTAHIDLAAETPAANSTLRRLRVCDNEQPMQTRSRVLRESAANGAGCTHRNLAPTAGALTPRQCPRDTQDWGHHFPSVLPASLSSSFLSFLPSPPEGQRHVRRAQPVSFVGTR